MYTQQVDQLMGQMVGGYRIEKLLSQGRLSAVYLARQAAQNQPVAITTFVIPEQFSVRARNRFIARFAQEATALTALSHPHLLPIYAYGEHIGYPYLVTPYVTEGSLAHVLKRQGRCTPAYTLEILTQVAQGLDYAHSKGVVHRALKPSNILLRGDRKVQVAGFGLVRILELRGVGQSEHPYAHLLSLAGTFLGTPEYLAPEAVKGLAVDTRADVYAFGIMLFELLSGKPPFTGGSDSLAIATQHLQQAPPSLCRVCPDAPPALDQVIARALARDPSLRYQRAGDVVAAYAQALQSEKRASAPVARVAKSREISIDPFSQYTDFDEDTESTGGWQFKPPIVTGQVPAVRINTSHHMPAVVPPRQAEVQNVWQNRPFSVVEESPARGYAAPAETPSTQPLRRPEEASAPAPRTTQPVQPALPTQATSNADVDAFAWWSGNPETVARSAKTEAAFAPAPVSAPAPAPMPVVGSTPSRPLVLPSFDESYGASSDAWTPPPRRRGKKKRREVIALLVTGGAGIAAAGVFAFGGPRVGRMIGDIFHPQMAGGGGTAPTQNTTSQTTPATNGKPTNKPSGGHTGKVIGPTTLAINSSVNFTNPADGKPSLLIHLPNGKFAAYEHACTHEGVSVNYDPNTHTLICPAHGAIFDPANNGSVLQGPAMTPLPHVAIRVNADGTITTG